LLLLFLVVVVGRSAGEQQKLGKKKNYKPEGAKKLFFREGMSVSEVECNFVFLILSCDLC
jgi:hypothetical protein